MANDVIYPNGVTVSDAEHTALASLGLHPENGIEKTDVTSFVDETRAAAVAVEEAARAEDAPSQAELDSRTEQVAAWDGHSERRSGIDRRIGIEDPRAPERRSEDRRVGAEDTREEGSPDRREAGSDRRGHGAKDQRAPERRVADGDRRAEPPAKTEIDTTVTEQPQPELAATVGEDAPEFVTAEQASANEANTAPSADGTGQVQNEDGNIESVFPVTEEGTEPARTDQWSEPAQPESPTPAASDESASAKTPTLASPDIQGAPLVSDAPSGPQPGAPAGSEVDPADSKLNPPIPATQNADEPTVPGTPPNIAAHGDSAAEPGGDNSQALK